MQSSELEGNRARTSSTGQEKSGRMDTFSRHELFWGMLPRKIHLAHRIYEQQGPVMLAMPHIRQQLALLEVHVAAVATQMQAAGIPKLCTFCAGSSVSGGCCSLAMADESDAILLLANLLAGSEVRVQREDGFECFFLGSAGCTLRFKPMFCLNYLCKRILQTIQAEELRQLELASGLLLQGQYLIEQLLVDYLHSKGRLV